MYHYSKSASKKEYSEVLAELILESIEDSKKLKGKKVPRRVLVRKAR